MKNTYEKYAALRDKNGVTDYRVSRDTGIVQATLSDWKSGKSNPKVDKLITLAKYFDVSIEYFISEA